MSYANMRSILGRRYDKTGAIEASGPMQPGKWPRTINPADREARARPHGSHPTTAY